MTATLIYVVFATGGLHAPRQWHSVVNFASILCASSGVRP